MSDIKRVREREGGEQFSEEIFLAVGRTRMAGGRTHEDPKRTDSQ